MRRQFLPYENAGGSLVLELVSATVPGFPEIPASFPVVLTGVQWTKCELDLRVTGNESLILKALPRGEQTLSAVRCLARLRNGDTRSRTAVRLDPDKPGTWTGKITVSREATRGKASIQAVLVRASDATEIDGIASARGARLAWSEAADIRSDYIPPVGEYLEIRFEKFRTHHDSLLNGSGAAVHILDLRNPQPILWINADIPGLKRVLDSVTPYGDLAAVRNAVNQSISQTVWFELITSAASSLEEGEVPTGWKGAVLRRAARWLDPDASSDATIQTIAHGLGQDSDPSDRDWLISQLSAALQRGLPVQRSIKNLLSALE
jgi:hypothetical protein